MRRYCNAATIMLEQRPAERGWCGLWPNHRKAGQRERGQDDLVEMRRGGVLSATAFVEDLRGCSSASVRLN